MTPRRLFATFAFAEAVTWTLLIVGMILKYVTHTTDLGVRVFGGVHGFVFLAYVVATLVVGIDRGWTRGTTLTGLLASVPPFATIPFERHVERRGLLDGGWRASEGHRPQNLPERVVALAVARPALAGVLILVALCVLFALLLWIGPPPVPRG